MIKHFTTKGEPINPSNPFLKYYGNSFAISKNATLLGDYIILVTEQFEGACIDIGAMIGFEDEYYSKYIKRRRTIYALFADLENLRKTMIRAQQIQKSQINKLSKENHNLKNKLTRVERGKVVIPFQENCETKTMISKNIQSIIDAKRHSAEITRCLANNIISAKQNLERHLDDFAMFATKVKDQHQKAQ